APAAQDADGGAIPLPPRPQLASLGNRQGAAGARLARSNRVLWSARRRDRDVASRRQAQHGPGAAAQAPRRTARGKGATSRHRLEGLGSDPPPDRARRDRRAHLWHAQGTGGEEVRADRSERLSQLRPLSLTLAPGGRGTCRAVPIAKTRTPKSSPSSA